MPNLRWLAPKRHLPKKLEGKHKEMSKKELLLEIERLSDSIRWFQKDRNLLLQTQLDRGWEMTSFSSGEQWFFTKVLCQDDLFKVMEIVTKETGLPCENLGKIWEGPTFFNELEYGEIRVGTDELARNPVTVFYAGFDQNDDHDL